MRVTIHNAQVDITSPEFKMYCQLGALLKLIRKNVLPADIENCFGLQRGELNDRIIPFMRRVEVIDAEQIKSYYLAVGQKNPRELHVSMVGLPKRVSNLLLRRGFNTLGDIMYYNQLVKMHRLGDSGRRVLLSVLLQNGLTLVCESGQEILDYEHDVIAIKHDNVVCAKEN